MNKAEQATSGLNIDVTRGIVVVDDGVDTWVCREDAYDAAIAHLAALDADESDDGGAEAYTHLCGLVGGTVAALNGTSRGTRTAQHRLLIDAIAYGAMEEDLAHRFGGWKGASKVLS